MYNIYLRIHGSTFREGIWTFKGCFTRNIQGILWWMG